MTTDNYLPNCQPGSAPHIPMGALLDLLNSNGFAVKPDNYVELLKIIERFGSADLDETARWICPAIVTSEQEQDKFYHLVEQYKTTVSLPACAAPPQAPRKKYNLLFLLLLVPAFFLVFYYAGRITCVLNEPQKIRTVAAGSPVVLDAGPLLQSCGADSGAITCRWIFEDGTAFTGPRLTHIFRQPGAFIVIRHFASRTVRLPVKSDSLRIQVCDHLPTLHISPPSGAITARTPVTLRAETGGDVSGITGYQWQVQDSVFYSTTPEVTQLIFPSEGFYTVTCRAVAGSVQSPCTVVARDNIQVTGRDKNYQVLFSPPVQKKYAGTPVARGWVSLLLLLLAAGGLAFPFISPARKRKPQQPAPARALQSGASQGPYEIPFAPVAHLLQREPLLQRIMLQMRYQAAEETYLLNINATINSIISAGGSPQLVFAPRKKQQTYLLLVERLNTRSLLTQLFETFGKTLYAEGLPVDLFFYDKNFTCYNDSYPAGISLNRLANIRQKDVLLILGTGYNLVYPVYPEIEEKYWRDLSRWQKKALITPIPFADWSVKETVLRQWLTVLPADIPALAYLVPSLRENTRISTSLLATSLGPSVKSADTDFRDTTGLQNYLGEEYLFQWLCAICIYPKLRWPLLLEIGKVILDRYGKPECLNYSNLLKICRIPWVQQGVFPQVTRLELLKLLEVDNELAARERLLALLNYSGTVYGEGNHFFEEEKSRLIITNQFILQAGNPTRYSHYNDSRKLFRKLWQRDALFDAPLKKYLDKQPGDHWTTPLSGSSQSTGLSLYFAKGIKATARRRVLINTATIGSAIAAIALWLFLMFGDRGGTRLSFPLLQVYRYPDFISVDLQVAKNFAACADTSGSRFRQLDGYLQLGSNKYPMQYTPATGLARFRVPYGVTGQEPATVMFAWDINRTAIGSFDFSAGLPASVQLSCNEGKPASQGTLEIRFNDSAGYRVLEPRLTRALANYLISAAYSPFTDSSKIVYHQLRDKPGADSIARDFRQAFGTTIRAIYLPPGKKIARATPPELFVNTRAAAATDSTKTANTVHQPPDFYHGMADNFFMKKQYAAALKQYQLAIEGDPRDALAWYQSGVCYELMGDKYIPAAISAYAAAIRLKPADPDYYYRRANLEFSLKKYKAAIADFSQVIVHTDKSNAGPAYASAYYYRGKSKLVLNDSGGACSDFKQAADLGLQAATRDYTAYCAARAVPDTVNQGPILRKKAPVMNQLNQQASLPAEVTAAQLAAWLGEVAAGKRTAAELVKSLGADLPVDFNGERITVTDMCKRLVAMGALVVINAEPVKDEYGLLTGLKVTTFNRPLKK